MISRRTAIKSGIAVTGAVGAAGVALPYFSAGAAETTDLDPATIAKFTRPMPLLPVVRPTSESSSSIAYTLRQTETTAEIVPGLRTRVATFNGHFAPPVLKSRSGRRTVVRQINNLTVPTSIHLHGSHVPQGSDGAPMDLIQPGTARTYTYPNTQPHANLWFHDHAHHQEAESVFRGLTGLYLLTDDTEQRLPLPSGAYDVPIALRDARFDDKGQFVYEMDDIFNRNVILANGRAWPYFEVAARKYRFRIVNNSNMRTFALALSDGASFTQIGSDGGLLAKPFTTDSVTLSSGERADIVVDFSKYKPGTELVLANSAVMSPPGPKDLVGQVLQFRVTRTATDNSSVPATLRTLPDLPAASRTRDVVLSMDETAGSHQAFINGKMYDPNRIDTEVAYGATEIWTVKNTNARAPHNFHIHLVQFRVLERNGQAVTEGPESGLKDTVNLNPGETVKIQATFTGYRGTYLYHCHIIDHAAMGMMATMRVS